VPDLAGWRRERMPALPETAYFTLPPDWICEVLSSSTARVDRAVKMPIYAAQGIPFLWLIDPDLHTLEVFVLSEGRWSLERVCQESGASLSGERSGQRPAVRGGDVRAERFMDL